MSTQKSVLAGTIAVFAIVLSYFLWTGIITQEVPPLALEEGSSLHASAFTVIPSSEEAVLWGLQEKWSLEIPEISVSSTVYLPSRRYWDKQQWKLLEEQMQIGMNQGLVAYPHSVDPGERGALFIAGHSSPPDERARLSSFGDIFAELPELSVGASIFLTSSTRKFEYVVERTQIVSPDQTELLAQGFRGSQLTLITCFPVGTTKDRYVVVAKLKKNQ